MLLNVLAIIITVLLIISFCAIVITPFVAFIKLIDGDFKTKKEFRENLFIWRIIDAELKKLKDV